MSTPTVRRGQIVTFYSYKGGTGRTMALANVAWILASAGHTVLTMDWDLESPGLHRYFQPFLNARELREREGIIDMINEYSVRARPLKGQLDEDLIEQSARVMQYAISLDYEFDGGGRLDFVSSGQRRDTYATAVTDFNWTNFYRRDRGAEFLERLAADLREHYDYALIDSRTGLSDIAGICTVHLPDIVVNCFGLFTQSIEGAVGAAESIIAGRVDRPVTILPTPMRVEAGEQLRLQASRDHARARFEPFLSEERRRAGRAFWSSVEIPYRPFYAYYETLATFGDKAGESQSLLAAYEQLTAVITDNAVTRYQGVPENERRRWLAEFERAHLSGTDDVLVLYATVDQSWAEWVAQTIAELGLRTELVAVDLMGAADPVFDRVAHPNRHVVAMLSRDFMAIPVARELWLEASGADVGEASALLIPIRLDISKVPTPFRDRPAVELIDTNAVRARQLIHAAFGSSARNRPATPVNPAEEVRFPADTPAVFSVPPRNPSFIGRGRQLQELRTKLASNPSAVVPQTLYGLGGVGKTQIAIEFAHRFKSEYDVIWWVPADQLTNARASLADLGTAMKLPGDTVSNRVDAVLAALANPASTTRWLVIFDNAESPDTLGEVIPIGTGHVLLTSRDFSWSDQEHMETLSVGTFEPAESVLLLRVRAPGLNETEARLITDALDNLPLAIEQAGAWLRSTGMSVAEYLTRLNTEAATMLDQHRPPGYPATAVATWTVSWDRLREVRPAAAMLLEQAAFFAPEQIPQSFLLDAPFRDELIAVEPNLDQPPFRSSLIQDLRRFSLAQTDNGVIQLHRLVQAVIRSKMDPEEAERFRARAIAILIKQDPQEPDTPEKWPTYRTILAHAHDVGLYQATDRGSRFLSVNLVRSVHRQGDSHSSLLLGREILEQWKPVHGDDDEVSLWMELQLANALRAETEFDQARDIDQRVLDRLTARHNADYPYALMAARSYGADLRAAGRYEEAHRLDDRLLPRFEEVFGENGPDTLMARNNLAVSKRLIGDFRGAADIDRRIYEHRRVARGEEHSSTLASANHYGRDLRDIGDMSSSRSILQRALAIYRRVPELGPNHRETLRAAKNLAVTLRKLGEFEDAHELVQDTLLRARQVYGPDHPETLACEMTMATTHSALGNQRSAIDIANGTLASLRTVVQEQDVYTMACLNNLAIFLRKGDRPQDAYSFAERAHQLLRTALAERHPYIFIGQLNLATSLSALGDDAGARPHAEEAFAGLRDTLGEEHPDAIGAGNNLALIRVALGDATGEELHDAMLRLAKTTIGLDNPRVSSAAARMRINCYIEPPPP